jgi:hypothetical protein
VKDLEKTTNGGSPNFLDTLLRKSRNIISTSSIAPEDLDALQLHGLLPHCIDDLQTSKFGLLIKLKPLSVIFTIP